MLTVGGDAHFQDLMALATPSAPAALANPYETSKSTHSMDAYPALMKTKAFLGRQ
jgi:hypothetical protein